MGKEFSVFSGEFSQLLSQPGGFADLILTDLPYGTTAAAWDREVGFGALWEACVHARKGAQTAIVLFAQNPFTARLVVSKQDWYRYTWVWEKNVPRGHLVAKKRPMQVTEEIVVFSEKPHAYYPVMVPREKPVKGKEAKRTTLMGGESVGYEAKYTHTYPRNLLKFDGVPNPVRVHPTEKPVDLLKYLIVTYLDKPGCVLDLTCGSGSTGEAALSLGHSFVGYEKDAEYCEVVRNRLSNLLVEGASKP
jgi:site-specific DNA-methyltransferase (adenine-specific)